MSNATERVCSNNMSEDKMHIFSSTTAAQVGKSHLGGGIGIVIVVAHIFVRCGGKSKATAVCRLMFAQVRITGLLICRTGHGPQPQDACCSVVRVEPIEYGRNNIYNCNNDVTIELT